MKHRGMVVILAVAAALVAGTAGAQDFQPAVIFDTGGKFDKSFNEAAYSGAEKFRRDTGIAYGEVEITNEAQREQALRALVRRGATVIAVTGFAQATALERVAPEAPAVKFCLIDGAVDLPNVRSITFKDHEGAYLVGMLASMASLTGRIGFIGGMDVPVIRNIAAGYGQGARFINKKIQVFQNMVGTTGAAWNDPARGAELARSQFDRGADIVFAAAGASGTGVLQAAADAGRQAIGVDSNQNGMFPGRVLTSMIKRVDVAVHDCWQSARDGTWQPGLHPLGLKEDGVGYALDEHNRKLITPQMERIVERAKTQIIEGKLTVDAYQP